jgi:hypothetical protein
MQGVPFKNVSQQQSQSDPPHVIDSPNFLYNTRVKVTLVPGCCSCQLHKECAGANMAHSQAECVFILEHYFALK